MSHQTYTSYRRFQEDTSSQKILLCTLEYAQLITGWSLTSTPSVYHRNVTLGTDDSIFVSLRQSLTTYTVENSLGGLNANNETFFNKPRRDLYVFQNTTDPTNNVHILIRRHHVATEPFIGHDIPNSIGTEKVYYEPRLLSISPFTTDRGEPFNSLVINSKGRLTLISGDGFYENITGGDGFYDSIIDTAFFENQEVRIYSHSPQLPIGSATFLGNGRVYEKVVSRGTVDLGFEDFFENINKIKLPLPNFNFRDLTNFGTAALDVMEPEARNKSPRYVYGRNSRFVPFNISGYGKEINTLTAAIPALNRNRTISDNSFHRRDVIITSITSNTEFFVSGTDGSLLTAGSIIGFPSTSAGFTRFKENTSTVAQRISAGGLVTQASGQVRVTVNVAFTAGMVSVNNTVCMMGVQELEVNGLTITAGETWNVNNVVKTSGDSLVDLYLTGSLESHEFRRTLDVLTPSDPVIIDTVFGKTSISAGGVYTVTADLLEWPGEIMLDLFQNVLSFTTQINTTSFLSADAIRPVQIGLVIPKDRKDATQDLQEIMESIQRTALGQFRIGRTGQLEYFVWNSITAGQDILTTVVTPLTDDDFLEYQESFDISRLNQQTRIFYNYAEAENSYQQFNIVNTQSARIFLDSERIKEIKTQIYSGSIAANPIPSLYSSLYSEPWKMIKCKVKMQAADLFIGDRILIHKRKKLVDLYGGSGKVWTSIGALAFGAAPSTQTRTHGYWTNVDGALTNGAGVDMFNQSVWGDSTTALIPIGSAYTVTSELFELISISKDGFNTEMVLTNYGGNVMRSTTTSAIGS